MSRSLAGVGLLTMICAAGVWTAVAQDSAQTTEGVVVKNHMSDAERDQLMRDAMDKARKDLEAQKAKEAQDATRAAEREKKKEQTRMAAEAAEEKIEQEKRAREAAEAASKSAESNAKAEQEKLARKLAEEEKTPSAYSADSLKPITPADKAVNLDPVKKADAAPAKAETAPKTIVTEKYPELTPAPKAETAKKASATEEKKPEVADKKSDAAPKKSEAALAKDIKDAETKGAPEPKVVVEKVATKDPKANLTVKAPASEPGGSRDIDKEVSYEKPAPGRELAGDSSSRSSDSIEGQVVGLMRSSGKPRILVRDDSGRMVQVVLEGNGLDVPAPGSGVAIRGRNVGGADGRQVLSASSVDIRSGSAIQRSSSSKSSSNGSTVKVIEEETVTIDPGPLPMMAPPIGMIPPPMPMMPGPMMMPPPPPF